MRTGAKRYNPVLEIVMAALACLVFYPIFLIAANAFKTREDMAFNPFGPPSRTGFTWDNVAETVRGMDIYKPLLNSVWITAGSLIAIIVFASMAAYPIARNRTKLYGALYLFFLSGIMIPFQLAMIPLYKEIKALGLMNSQWGMILIYSGVFLSFPVFFYSGFIKSVPLELEEAARIDGCGRFRLFWTIVFPLLRPATATVAILSLLAIWNEFGLSFLFLQKTSSMTLVAALFSFRGQYHVNWPHMFAGVLIAALPIVIAFLCVQSYFVKGIADGALKG
ncbi:carbohydrate ABC transporter permease [Paenibacillus flagellatus]|uniref:ABC transmembrane type-1 domain-containing protein n=1 Tax=Paenibacillus flagellatus TaxID=2211139 RepID=A0A2V5K9R0_9BACL|nr:carbohydrate ABC transporter permease [Paenibacillus flagellatus]PYI56259.1 hypothetical protein DLM86_04540 [Paenibacillus flagellatus]